MRRFSSLLVFTAIVATVFTMHATASEPINRNCYVSPAEKPDTFRLQTDDGDCHGHKNCENSRLGVFMLAFFRPGHRDR